MNTYFVLKTLDDEYITKNYTLEKNRDKALIFTNYVTAQDQLTILLAMNEDYYKNVFVSTL